MASNILSIGQSALAAAQAGLATTGHNIANASTPGYSRQSVVQSAAQPQEMGYGFVGRGTQIETIKRIYSDFLGKQVISSQTAKQELDSYYTQVKQIDNLLADSSAGLSPMLQDFFKAFKNLASNPSSIASRQSTLSAGDALVGRFQLLARRLDEIGQGVNSQIATDVGVINSYAQQIARLNNSIENAQGSNGAPPNDLMDQRDLLVSELSKEIRTTVIQQDGGKYSVFIGNGSPLVVGGNAYGLQAMPSPIDGTRIEPYYVSNGNLASLGEGSLIGGRLGGLTEFRASTLDTAENALGRIAIGLASSFNAQHRLGQDINGNPGADFFTVASPLVRVNGGNAGNANISAAISDAKALTTSDYRLKYDGTSYVLTRVDDGAIRSFGSLPQTVDGFDLTLASGVPAPGDQFLIRPTANGAGSLSLVIGDTKSLAAAAPIRLVTASTNTGTGTMTSGEVDSSYLAAPLTGPLSISYSSATNALTGFPSGLPVSVSNAGLTTTYPPGAPVNFAPGAEIRVGGIGFSIGGAPANGDTFTFTPNLGAVGDNRNALLLAGLQTSNTLSNGTATYQGAYAQLVSLVGNKTRELETTTAAADKMLSEAVQSQQAESGVNLDEEATNLLRYQQAYQAAGKLMQIANNMFDVLLDLGQ